MRVVAVLLRPVLLFLLGDYVRPAYSAIRSLTL